MVRTPPHHCRALGLILGQITKIPHAVQLKPKKKKKNLKLSLIRCLGDFPFFIITNYATIDIHVHKPLHTFIIISIG